jgi:hypothetical protein
MDAMRAEGFEPKTVPIASATDGRGSRSWACLPNLSTGGINYHGRSSAPTSGDGR